MVSFAYRVYGLTTEDAPHVLGFSATGVATGSLVEIWDGPTNSSARWRVDQAGDIIPGPISAADLATSAAVGFTYARSCNGPPTGTPTNAANGAIPHVIDRSNLRAYWYIGSTWRYAALT